MIYRIRASILCTAFGLLLFPSVSAADTLLSNISQSNNAGTSVFRSNIWDAFQFTAGGSATITSVTVNLDPTASNYTSFSTYQSGVIRFYNDNAGAVGSAISGTLSYTSTNSGTGHTVYANQSGTISLPSAGTYWIAFTCASCANVDYRETTATGYSGSTGWATILSSASRSTSNNAGSSWGTPFSTATFGTAMITIEGTLTSDETAPTVSVSAPANGATVSGSSVTISASASDNVSVAGVKFYVDGVLQGSEDTSSPYSISWDSTATSSGSHVIFAVARDSSNNYATSTSISVTVDNDAPVISAVASSTTSTTATITWTTDEAASTKVVYSVDTTYASTTAETDTSTRVTSHSTSITNLLACTFYNFRVVSRDAAGNSATSTSASFTTSGCSGGATPSSSTSTPITVSSAATSTVTDNGRTLTVETPADFTATSSTITIQIKGLSASTVLDSIGKPSGLSSAASIVFDVKALIDNITELDSFDTPVTITYTYTDADVEGLDESTLKMYHYANNAWSQLDNCSVNTSANTITCTAPHFSIFAIFGNAQSSSTSSSTGASGGGVSVQGRVANLLASGNVALAEQLMREYPQAFPRKDELPSEHQQYRFTRSFKEGASDEDVKALQLLLIQRGYAIQAGATGYFGRQTREALARFQSDHGITPASGYFGPMTRAFILAMDGETTTLAPKTQNTKTSDLLSTQFTRDLWLIDQGEDVRALQKYLISQGYPIRAGATGYFGEQTREALVRFQNDHSITPAVGYFGPKTRAYIGEL